MTATILSNDDPADADEEGPEDENDGAENEGSNPGGDDGGDDGNEGSNPGDAEESKTTEGAAGEGTAPPPPPPPQQQKTEEPAGEGTAPPARPRTTLLDGQKALNALVNLSTDAQQTHEKAVETYEAAVVNNNTTKTVAAAEKMLTAALKWVAAARLVYEGYNAMSTTSANTKEAKTKLGDAKKAVDSALEELFAHDWGAGAAEDAYMEAVGAIAAGGVAAAGVVASTVATATATAAATAAAAKLERVPPLAAELREATKVEPGDIGDITTTDQLLDYAIEAVRAVRVRGDALEDALEVEEATIEAAQKVLDAIEKNEI